ncbi:glutathione S-transferase family protein [Microbulbifer thermotolerans]|uniref:glutathione S-transferase family protein n=1 Tax=Microbulbifer thermotolerans TaxID=252514 RepID=UPI002248CB84|nr:glutathione S-transferase family protein [Microbulbifer thermotolerans]MCX2830771.1 glutathione S-transferase family protein [Microbulbifer thermotolerans]
MAEELIFYTNPQSRGRIVRWMLEEVGVPYETRVLEYGTTMKSPEYLSINPMGKVPAIVHGGRVVTECAAICAYLADALPEAGLLPQTLDEKANYYRWLFFAAGPLESVLNNRAVFKEEPEVEKQRMLGYGNFRDTLNALSVAVKANPYIAGDRFTAADVYVGSHIGWGLQFGTMESREEFIRYFDRLRERPAYTRAMSLDDVQAKEISEG